MALIECPCCSGLGSVIHGHCNGGGCDGCIEGELHCDVCGGDLEVEEPLFCHDDDHRSFHGDFDERVLTALRFLRVKVTEKLCLDHAREHAVMKRWATHAKPCKTCATYIIWRHESGRRVCLDSEARHHACPEKEDLA